MAVSKVQNHLKCLLSPHWTLATPCLVVLLHTVNRDHWIINISCLPPDLPRHSHICLSSPLFSHAATEMETLYQVVLLNPPPRYLKDLTSSIKIRLDYMPITLQRNAFSRVIHDTLAMSKDTFQSWDILPSSNLWHNWVFLIFKISLSFASVIITFYRFSSYFWDYSCNFLVSFSHLSH